MSEDEISKMKRYYDRFPNTPNSYPYNHYAPQHGYGQHGYGQHGAYPYGAGHMNQNHHAFNMNRYNGGNFPGNYDLAGYYTEGDELDKKMDKNGQLIESRLSPNRFKNQQVPVIQKEVQKHPRTSIAIDAPDQIHIHVDPISVSLQERVKFGGHITSVTKKPYHKIPFYFALSEKNPSKHISKRAILSKEVEKEEGRDKSRKVNYITKEIVDKKAMTRDYERALQAKEIQRIEAEVDRRERDISTKQDKYFDPEAFEHSYRFFQN